MPVGTIRIMSHLFFINKSENLRNLKSEKHLTTIN